MATDSHFDHDRTLDEIVGDYLDRLNAGEHLDTIRILEEHPHIGSEVLAALRTFVGLGSDTLRDGRLGTLGDYTLRRQIGRGGMGVVYEAWENSMDRAVALKVLPVGVAADDRAFQRFMQEAKTAGKLSHQNIVPVYSTGVKEGTPWFSMEFVEGETLAQILARIKEAEPEPETPFGKKDDARYLHKLADAFADVADGLQHAHSKGVTHRDVKPSNLILDSDGRLRILDFGLARLEGQESVTLSGGFVGTPLYMSPEQARRKRIPVDHRTDVYSLGATMYEAVCGRPPFRGKDHEDTLSQIIERDPVEPRKVNPRVPKDLETIVLKCLRKDSGDRYGTAEALGQDLRRFVRGDPIEAKPQTALEALARRFLRHKVRLGIIAAMSILVTACTLLALQLFQRNRQDRDAQYESRVVAAAMELLRGEIVLSEARAFSLGDRRGFFLYRDVLVDRGRLAVESAVEKLDNIAAIDSTRFEAHFYRARGLRLLSREEEAIAEVQAALAIEPEFMPARMLLAFLGASRPDSRTSMSPNPPISQNASNSWGDTWGRAFRAELDARLQSAIDAYDELVSLDAGGGLYLGSTLEFLLRRGELRLRNRNYDGARLDFARAEALSGLGGDFMEPALLLGKSYLLEGGVAKARRIFERLNERRRDQDDTALWIAAIYGSFGRATEALEWATEIREDDSRLRIEAPLLASLGRVAEAEAAFRRLLKRMPRDAEVHIGLARVLLERLGGLRGLMARKSTPQLAEVLQLLDKARELAPESRKAYYFLGMLCQTTGELGRAREFFEMAEQASQQRREERLMNRNDIRQIGLAATIAIGVAGVSWAHEGTWENVRLADNLSGIVLELESAISPDGLELYFSSDQSGGFGSTDIYLATRRSLEEPFAGIRNLGSPINSSASDTPSCLSADALELYIFSRRNIGQENDIFVLRREAPEASWSEPVPIAELNTSGNDVHVTISPDGHELVFASDRPGGAGDNDLWLASRADSDAPWQVVGNISSLNSVLNDRAPIFSSDGRTLFFDRWLRGSISHLWCATRNEETGAFENPRRIEGPVNDGGWNGNATISPAWPADGSELYWTRSPSFDMADIYVATWRRGDATRFLRGDCNEDGEVSISDGSCMLNWLFLGGPTPGCVAVTDTNGENGVNIADASYLLNFLFLGGPPLTPPFPECGTSDLETDATLGCVETSCP